MRYLILVLLLAGCGAEDAINDYTSVDEDALWDGNYQESSSNFYVKYTPENPKRPMIPDVERWWSYIKQCTGFAVDISHAPLVINYKDGNGLGPNGDVGMIWWDRSYTEVLSMDVYDGRITRHEMLHYLLYQIGESDTNNRNHTASYWDDCDIQYVDP